MPYVSAWMEGLTPEMTRIAEQELGETPEVKKQALKDLRKLINAEADFRPLPEDIFLLRFLRVKKYDVKKAFLTLRNYYIFKARYSGILTDFKPTDVQHVLDMNNVMFLPQRHPSGALVGCIRLAHFDIDKISAEQIFATFLVGMEVALQLEATQVCGYIGILDASKLSLRLVRHYASPTLLYRCVRLMQDCIPCRMKGFHIINEPFYFSIMYSILKTFLSEKLTKRLHLHGSNLKSLHQYVPADILTSEFGGKIGPMSSHTNDLMKRILSRESSFEKLNKYGFLDKKIQYFKKQDSRSVFS